MRKRILSFVVAMTMCLPMLAVESRAEETLKTIHIGAGQTYRITNAEEKYSTLNYSDAYQYYDRAIYNKDGTVYSCSKNINGGFSIPSGGYADVTALDKGTDLYYPYELKLSTNEVSHSALRTIHIEAGQTYRITNAEEKYSTLNYSDAYQYYDRAIYNKDGTVYSCSKNINGGFSIPSGGYADVTALDKGTDLYYPYELKLSTNEVSHSALKTIHIEAGQTYRITNAEEKYSTLNYSDAYQYYDRAIYNKDGTVYSCSKNINGGFSIPSGGYADVTALDKGADFYFPYGIALADQDINDNSESSTTEIMPTVVSDYLYDTLDPGESVTLDAEALETVSDSTSAAAAVSAQTKSMTEEQKTSATGADLATLYAETAVSKAASKTVSGSEILINKVAVTELEAIAKQTSEAVESALVSGGVSTARYLSNTVTMKTEETGEISIRIDPDILETEVDKIVVETPTYAITLKVDDLKEDLTQIVTITAQDVGSGFAPGNTNKKTTVKVNLPNGKTTNPVTLSLPKDSGDAAYQAVVNTSGAATSSKYNPATKAMDGKVNASGSYTVQTNQKDFSDIANKSAEMQKAIRYLASKGIINGTDATHFSPDGSITRAEIAALMVRALGKVDNSAKPTFKDVTTANWYYSTAASSQKAGLINGYEDNTFRGGNQINKEQIVAVSARVLTKQMGYKAPSNASSYLGRYTDSVVGWAQADVALATRENLVVYRTDGTFSGSKGMTRGDAAIIIYRLFQRIW